MRTDFDWHSAAASYAEAYAAIASPEVAAGFRRAAGYDMAGAVAAMRA